MRMLLRPLTNTRTIYMVLDYICESENMASVKLYGASSFLFQVDDAQAFDAAFWKCPVGLG